MTLTSDHTPTFSTLSVLWMLTAGLISGLLFWVLTAYAPDLRRVSDGGANPMSRSAIGFAGLAELLRDEGVPVVVSREPHPERMGRPSLLVVTPELGGDVAALTSLKSAGLELIILPKWRGTADERRPGWVKDADLTPLSEINDGLLHHLDPGDHLVRAKGSERPRLTATKSFFKPGSLIPAGEIEHLQTIAGPDAGWTSAVVDQNGATLVAKKVDQELYILSDPDLMNNLGLAQLGNAKGASLLINAMRDQRQPVIFDVTLAGFTRGRSLLRLALEPPFLAATLCALTMAALMGLHALTRFGPPPPPSRVFDFGKRALTENSAALIHMVGREHRMGRGYAALIRDQVARAVAAPRDLDDEQLEALLDRLGQSRRATHRFSVLERAAREARDVSALISAARALHQWRREMTFDHH